MTEEPTFRDKRRIDPETGKLREPAGEQPVGPGAEPADGAAVDDTAQADAPEVPAGEPGMPDTSGQPGEQPAGSEDVAASDTQADDANLADLKAENAKLADELARANASYFNLNNEYSAFVRRSKDAASVAKKEGAEKMATALLGVLDDIDLARQHGELEGPFLSISEKLESTLKTNFGLERYGAPGDEFDPAVHEALMDQPSDEVTTPTIAQVIQPGYRLGEKLLRAARVVVNSPA